VRCIYFDAGNTKSELIPRFIFIFFAAMCANPYVGSIVQIDRQERYAFFPPLKCICQAERWHGLTRMNLHL